MHNIALSSFTIPSLPFCIIPKYLSVCLQHFQKENYTRCVRRQARSQVLSFVGENKSLGEIIFVFITYFKQIFLGTTQFERGTKNVEVTAAERPLLATGLQEPALVVTVTANNRAEKPN